ncbi:hypothetical protein QBC45DRAFT_391263 [Copromyces sp. CBS 386.78]|nr:hypothetical protein QBC45DRAFT_391263 [Copromyces sp. CBS 386.78]
MAANINRKAYANKGKRKATQRKKYNATPEEDAAVKAFFAESPKSKEKKSNDNEQFYQAADQDSDENAEAEMENPLSEGNLGLAGSRYATAKDEEVKDLPAPEQRAQAAFHSKNARKYRASAEEDAMVKEFFAESPKANQEKS